MFWNSQTSRSVKNDYFEKWCLCFKCFCTKTNLSFQLCLLCAFRLDFNLVIIILEEDINSGHDNWVALILKVAHTHIRSFGWKSAESMTILWLWWPFLGLLQNCWSSGSPWATRPVGSVSSTHILLTCAFLAEGMIFILATPRSYLHVVETAWREGAEGTFANRLGNDKGLNQHAIMG